MSSYAETTIAQHAPAVSAPGPSTAFPPSPGKSDSSGLSDESHQSASSLSPSNAMESNRAELANGSSSTQIAYSPNGNAVPSMNAHPTAPSPSLVSNSTAGPASSALVSSGHGDTPMDTDSDEDSNAGISAAAAAAARSKSQRQSRGGFDEAEANPDLYGLRRSVSSFDISCRQSHSSQS